MLLKILVVSIILCMVVIVQSQEVSTTYQTLDQQNGEELRNGTLQLDSECKTYIKELMESMQVHGLSSTKDKINSSSKPVFDERYDVYPVHCQKFTAQNCAEATECTQTSSYYYITVSRYYETKFLAYCEYSKEQGDWTYILRRVDGSENFNRSWKDYVNGFGNVAGEHWIGLENLHALTNYNGPQELYVFIENFKGESRYAHYDNFVVGSAADEHYKLKSLGRYSGTAGDSMTFNIGAGFCAFDYDPTDPKCAYYHKGGWWFERNSDCDCGCSNPTGFYHRGEYPLSADGDADGVVWNDFGGNQYSHKTMIFKIRRQRTIVDQ